MCTPPLRTVIRHTSGRGSAVGGLTREERTGRGGDYLVHSAFAHSDSAVGRQGRGRRRADAGRTHGTSPISGRRHGRRQAVAGRTHGQERGLPCALPPLRTVIRHTSGQGHGRRRAGAGCCARRRPPLPSPSPTLRSATRDTGPQRRDLFPTAARTLPGSGRRANDILYIRVRRREARTFCTGRRATMWITFPWITHCG